MKAAFAQDRCSDVAPGRSDTTLRESRLCLQTSHTELRIRSMPLDLGIPCLKQARSRHSQMNSNTPVVKSQKRERPHRQVQASLPTSIRLPPVFRISN